MFDHTSRTWTHASTVAEPSHAVNNHFGCAAAKLETSHRACNVRVYPSCDIALSGSRLVAGAYGFDTGYQADTVRRGTLPTASALRMK